MGRRRRPPPAARRPPPAARFAIYVRRRRVAPARDRTYALTWQPALVSDGALARTWGRTGGAERTCNSSLPHSSLTVGAEQRVEADAQDLAQHVERGGHSFDAAIGIVVPVDGQLLNAVARRRARYRISMSKPQPLMRWRRKRSRATGRWKALKPPCVSSMPLTTRSWTRRLKTRPR